MNALGVKQHDVFLLELVDAIGLLRWQSNVCVDQDGNFTTKFVQLWDRPFQRVECFEDSFTVHLLTNLNDYPEFV